MVSAYLIARGRAGYAAAAFRSEQDSFDAGFVGSLCSASQSRAGWASLPGRLRWRHG
jgi:hypothetical protein